MESGDRKHRRFLARHRALAATFRKRKRAEAIFDLTCDRSSAPQFDYAFPEHRSELGVVGARQPTAGSALHSNGGKQSSVMPSVHHKAARSTSSTACRAAPPPSMDSCYEHANEQSNPPVLHPIMCSNPAQKQQHAHAQAAAALDEHSPYQASPRQAISCRANPHHSGPYQANPHQASPHQAGLFQANPCQQFRLHTAVVDCYTSKHDSFQMISNAVAGCSADKLCSSGCLHQQGSSVQSHTDVCVQEQPSYKKQRAVHIAGSAALPVPHAGHPVPLLPKVTETVGRHLQMREHRAEAPRLLCAASQWVDATVIPHSLPFQSLNHSTASSAGSAGPHALAGDGVRCSAPGLPASMQQLRDPRPQVDVEVPQGASACFPDQPQASTHCRPLTPPQTVPQYNQFLLEGPSRKRPPAGPVGLHTVPSVKAPARASILGAGFMPDDSVTITPGHRQTWDWSHGPLYSFRALCRAPIQQHQQHQLLIAAQRGSYTSSPHMGSRASVSEIHGTWQNHLPLPLPEKSYLSSQQPSIADIAAVISHHSSSASRPSSASPAYSSEQFSLHHELLPFCSSSSAQQPRFQCFFQCSSSSTLPVLLPCSLGYPAASPSASPSASVSLPAVPDASPFFSSAVQHAVQAASMFPQRQMTHSASASRALSSPLPWRTNTSFDLPLVCGLPKLGPTVWSPDAVVPDNACRWGPNPRLMVGDGKTQQQGHMNDPCSAELDLQELQRSTLSWMASELVPAGSYDASFHD